jgi:hypothetical protein
MDLRLFLPAERLASIFFQRRQDSKQFVSFLLLVPMPFNLELQPTEIPDPFVIVAEFKEAAKNAKLAGFDGVERTSCFLHNLTQF